MKKFWLVTGLIIFFTGMAWGQSVFRWVGATGGDWGIDTNWTRDSVSNPGEYPGQNNNNDIVFLVGDVVDIQPTVTSLQL